jgi:hypothetical protein
MHKFLRALVDLVLIFRAPSICDGTVIETIYPFAEERWLL